MAAVALLVLATIGNPMWGIVYLAVFGIGTVAGMMLITVGMCLIYQIAFVDGLFTGYAHWTPR